MHAEQQFKRWMRILVAVFIGLFVYIITADRHIPLTTEGRVLGHVVQIAPEVTGKITRVLVRNNQQVKAGDPLFVIDDRKYQIALEKALLALKSASEQEATLYSQREAARANISRANANYQNAHREYRRLKKLAGKKVVSQSAVDNAEAENQIAQATLRAERQNLKVIESRLGPAEGESTAVLQAINRVARAELDLTNTTVLAPSDGVITNLQLEAGTLATVNQPLLTFVPTDSLWVSGDFREKSVAGIDQHYAALVTFDALPGQIYHFHVSSRDFGVADVQQRANGSLTEVASNNRWVRDAQRTRINLAQTQPLPPSLFVGSRATVTLFPADHRVWSLIASAQIRIASWFHFIY